MLNQEELKDLAKARLEEARILHDNSKYDGAVYLCGYAIELTLKYVVLRDRLWGFPEEQDEFKLYEEAKTHDLEKLLRLADKMQLLNDRTFQIPWNYVNNWRSEFRYRPVGTASVLDSAQMLPSARDIMTALGVS
ncbi:HEPN domain-containing protein [Candidatus Uhrbacteria bacterium]|nr:HEPN domain-containing protein [Candidatus Uhrbacteria bacterium]